MRQAKWIQSDGGPLICIPMSAAHLWFGTDGTSFESAGGLSDYERACAIDGYLGLIQVRDRVALVLGDMPMATSILQSRLSEIYIVRLMYMDDQEDVIDYILEHQEKFERNEQKEIVNFESDGSGIIIFDSAYLSSECEIESISYPLTEGTYRIDTRIIELEDRASFLLHGISRL